MMRMIKDADHGYGHGPEEPNGLENQQSSGGDFRILGSDKA